MEYAHSGIFYPPIPRTMSNGHMVNVWIQVPHDLIVPATAVTSSGRVIEMNDMDEGHQEGIGVDSRGFILPERVVREPWHLRFT